MDITTNRSHLDLVARSHRTVHYLATKWNFQKYIHGWLTRLYDSLCIDIKYIALAELK